MDFSAIRSASNYKIGNYNKNLMHWLLDVVQFTCSSSQQPTGQQNNAILK